MDTNIDPTIAESDLFHVSLDRSNKESNDLHEHEVEVHEDEVAADTSSIRNVFRLNEYVSGNHSSPHGSSHDDSSTAAAALSMIQFNGFDNHHDSTNQSNRANIENLTSSSHYHQYSDDQLLDEEFILQQSKPTSSVKLVQYNPSEKTKRLGRPRKHISKSLTPPEDSSSQNYNESILSKFRLDALPLEGPGSRGGRQGGRRSPRGRITSGSIRKRKKQTLLNFTGDKEKSKIELRMESQPSKQSTGIDQNSNILSSQPSKHASESGSSKKPDEELDKVIEISSQSESPVLETNKDKSITTPHKINKLTSNKAISSKKAPPKKKLTKNTINTRRSTVSKVTSTRRTTVNNNRHKATRQLSGPLIGLYYDLYDDNILEAKQNMEASSEKIALGFPVLKSPYANNILIIISFLNKFKEVVLLDKIGPQDIEKGLSLPPPKLVSNGNFISKSLSTTLEDYDPSYISPEMNQLFSRLLTLVLNRKKDITSQTKAISELKSMSLYLGLPKEWRDDSNILEKHTVLDKEDSPVDMNNPDILLSESNEYHPPIATINPFYSPEFELNGLKGLITPVDRLIMLRTLVHWSLTASDQIKNYISQSVQKQDYPGEKETSYVARSILKGFKNTEDAKKEAELKLAKRKNVDNELKYIDPTSNPLEHNMRLRLDELFAGDCGFHIGRFYLCRMSDSNNGGLASVSKMKSVWDSSFTSNFPSQFKLYVQDVHQMLTDSLSNFGVEFNENGEEIKNIKVEGDYWYEVASNGKELGEFVDYLARRLGITVADEPIKIIPKTSMCYKLVLNLFNYLSSILPLALKKDLITLHDERVTRNRVVDYSERKANKKIRDLIEDEDEDEAEYEDNIVNNDEFDEDEDYEDEYEEMENNDEEYEG